MTRNRRFFLKALVAGGGATIAAGTLWVATGKSRSARWLRRMIADSRREIKPAHVTPNPAAWSDNQITICWIGHATTLINFYGIKILTDPAFGSRVGISLGLGVAGPKRYIAPALRLSELPPVDLILLSHAHMDHLDLPSLKHFPRDTPVYTAEVTADLVRGTRLRNTTELGWNDSAVFHCSSPGKGDLRIEALEVKHWGQRWPSELARGYNGYILRREGKALLFGGDTAKTPRFGELKSRGPFEAAIMPIGAYRPWIWNHCTPEEAVLMADAAGAKHIVPVHHQTFKLSDEPMNEPIQRLEAALAAETGRIALRNAGEHFIC
jgi:L-ascorbate metabolism protein UlaG (beta-lactamase superfamily)